MSHSYREKLNRRVKLAHAAQGSNKVKAELAELARRDIIFFVNQFCWTYDPRPGREPHHFPFITYPFQDEYLLLLEKTLTAKTDLLTDKSRDMGATWLVIVWITYHWLFDRAFTALLGSEKQSKTDNFDPESLFGKIDYLLRRLPNWILPDGFDIKKHRNFMKITSPIVGNSILGDSANADFSRQGRYSCIFFDEFASWERANSAWTSALQASPVRIVVSTPKGKNNKFADLRFNSQIRRKSIHWTSHPLKDQKWYELEKSRSTPREIAQELDIDYEASGSERVFPLYSDKTLYENAIVGPFDASRTWRFGAGLDYGTRNKSAFHVCCKDFDGTFYVVWEWRRNMEDLADDGFRGSMVQAIAWHIVFDCPYTDLIEVIEADPSLWVKNQNSPEGMTSIIQQIQEEIHRLKKLVKENHGETVRVPSFKQGAQSDIQVIEFMRSLWADSERPRLKIFKSCKGLIEELQELMWEDWSETQQNTRNIREKIMDKNNHCFIGSTKITMSDGSIKKIKDVKEGDQVMTSTGPNKVIEFLPHNEPKEIFRIYLSNGKTIDSTENHKIYTENGLVTVDAFKYGMLLFDVCENTFYLKAKNIDGTGSISHQLEGVKRGEKDCTLQFGRKRTGLFLKVTVSITKIITGGIIKLKTLRSWIEANMLSSMQRNLKILKLGLNTQKGYINLDSRLKSGIEAKKAESGTANMLKIHGKKELKTKSFQLCLVNFVAENLKHISLIALSFVTQIATKLVKGQGVWVVGVRRLNIKDYVYDLSIENTHNYYANGILVSNSFDSLKYYLLSKANDPVRQEMKPLKGTAGYFIERMNKETSKRKRVI